MKYYRSLKIIIILCFFSFQISAKDEVLPLDIITTAENSESNRFFLDAIISSFNLYSINKDVQGFALEDVNNVIVIVSKTKGNKCQRCWKYNEKLVNDEICNRCHKTIL